MIKIKVAVFLVTTILVMAVLPGTAEKEFLPPNYVFSTNYYNSYGVPDLYASVLGDPEYQRGEAAIIKIELVNKGVFYGVGYDRSVGTNPVLHAISLQELEYEKQRTTAVGIKAELVSDNPYIDVEPVIAALETLIPGQLPDDPLTFSIKISEKAPAGVYYLSLPVSYQYQRQVLMTTTDVMRLGIPSLDHITLYASTNKTLLVPVSVKSGADFEVVDVSGQLVAGEEHTIDVTYMNSGEMTADQAQARMVVMRPLKVIQPVASIGTIGPGERKTVSFTIAADADAVVKNHRIESEIKYYNEEGEIAFSDYLLVNVPLVSSRDRIGINTIATIGTVLLFIFLLIRTLRKV